MKTYAFIPARYQSSRFPGKPLAPIAGKPMIQHVYERARSCPELSMVYVATDDERISDCVHRFGGEAIMTETSHRSGTDRIAEASEAVGVTGDDIIINIQGDQPVFNQSIIPSLMKPLAIGKTTHMTTLMWRIIKNEEVNNPNHVKVVTDNDGFALYFSRSAIPYYRETDSFRIYYKHLGFYGYKMDFLKKYVRLQEGTFESAEKLEQLRAIEHGFKIKVLETPFNSPEVDVPGDVEIIEKILNDHEVDINTAYAS